MNVAIIVGHTPDSPGAVSIEGVSEFVYNNPLADRLVKILRLRGFDVEKVLRGRPNQYSKLPAKVNRLRFGNGGGADIAVSLHFNAASFTASGTEMLYWYSSVKSRRLAALLQEEVINTLHTRDRGIKPRTSRDRGAHLLRKTSMPCVIVEPFFGSNNEDWLLGKNQKAKLTNAYALAIGRYRP